MPHYSSCDVLRHFDAFVCLPLGDTLPCHGPRILRQPSVTLSAITTPPVQFTSVLPVLDPATNRRSNPIAHRVRRKRQRLPPSLLIENASDRYPLPPKVCPEAFPIKASDDTSRIHEHITELRLQIAQQHNVGLACSHCGIDGVSIGRPGNSPGNERGLTAEVGNAVH